jgi:alpha-L-rhamnosidase
MLGLRHLYMALNRCGLQEYGYRILTAEGFPSYKKWLDNGATTLWELWSCRASKNHHMYSDFMSWLIKTAGGINPDENKPCFDTVEIAPYYFTDLTFVRAHYETPKGRVETEWTRENGTVTLTVTAPTGDSVISWNFGSRWCSTQNAPFCSVLSIL